MKKWQKSAQRKAKIKAFVESIKANRRETSKPSNTIFTNIKSEKKKVKIPDYLRYLFS